MTEPIGERSQRPTSVSDHIAWINQEIQDLRNALIRGDEQSSTDQQATEKIEETIAHLDAIIEHYRALGLAP